MLIHGQRRYKSSMRIGVDAGEFLFQPFLKNSYGPLFIFEHNHVGFIRLFGGAGVFKRPSEKAHYREIDVAPERP